jgi:hypothetical protein
MASAYFFGYGDLEEYAAWREPTLDGGRNCLSAFHVGQHGRAERSHGCAPECHFLRRLHSVRNLQDVLPALGPFLPMVCGDGDYRCKIGCRKFELPPPQIHDFKSRTLFPNRPMHWAAQLAPHFHIIFVLHGWNDRQRMGFKPKLARQTDWF